MEPEDMRRELDGLRASIGRKPSRGWVIATSIITTLLVLVVIAAIMMFAMMNRMHGVGWRGHGPDRYFDQPLRRAPPPPPGQPLPR
ncbi:hypothetical protein PsW64_00494 [Pseudovibrio sp. W64]|uniref:hypothetical protein n=1 Tax=unclassified Pseudovibrio TaxID=2627060 RepID=UPI0007AE9847|nr:MULTISPECIES: hypothetical protein [unclassified Pseudovibrio]KZK89866.1 hypothetical protein PsW64_00494 [Pseudovibrio sp. W64]KZK97530.1 hypothetical protein PsW74_03664 [Pseudovibrio sp. W74]KZL04766.1 hypothetical protein PsAD14_05005 [Pseudovibrio sp. Ad14]